MRKLSLVFIAMFSLLNSVVAQEILSPKKNQYTYEASEIHLKDMFQIMEAHPNALSLLKSARSNKALSYVTGISGGFMAGYTIGTIIGDDWQGTLIEEMSISAGLIALSFIFDSGRKKQSRKAVERYNTTILSGKSTSQLLFQPTNNGLGLVLNF